MTTKRKPKSWDFWCGFSGGEPYVDEIHDEHCVPVGGHELPVKQVVLYLTEEDARPRFMDVRRVRVTIAEDGK